MNLTDAEKERIRSSVGAKQQEIEAAPLPAGVIPLEIHCTWSSCRHGRHALDHFQRARGSEPQYPPGHCQQCGKKIVDFEGRDETAQPDETQFFGAFANFPKELIRAHYWKVPIDLRAYHQALRMGRTKLHERAQQRVLDSMLINDAWSRRRAPYSEDVIAYAQHATAGCCRQCAAVWHGLPVDLNVRPSDEQLEYVIELVQVYLDLRLPELPDEPTAHVPRIRANDGPTSLAALKLEDDVVAAFIAHDDPAGLVVPKRSGFKLIAGRDATGGFVEPERIWLPHPGAA